MRNLSRPENRLPASYRLRLQEAGISRDFLAGTSAEFHPDGRPISAQFFTRVILGLDACPDWMRGQFDTMLREADDA